MSLLSRCEPLACDSCPFERCDEASTCYRCFCSLDSKIKTDVHCDEGTHPDNCPLLDGKVITIKEENGNLVIGHDYK